MHEGTSSKDAASSFVNPLTALGFIETMKMENHSSLVHTAAASNLGQMLIKICLADSIPLVNIIRKKNMKNYSKVWELLIFVTLQMTISWKVSLMQ